MSAHMRIAGLRKTEEKLELVKESLGQLQIIARAQQDLNVDKLFLEVVEKVLQFVMTPAEFRKQYGMSPHVVTGWLTGESVPHPSLRQRICARLKEKIEAKLKR